MNKAFQYFFFNDVSLKISNMYFFCSMWSDSDSASGSVLSLYTSSELVKHVISENGCVASAIFTLSGLHAVIAVWLNASQICQVGVGVDRSTRV